ncbi:MAG: 7-cyano-7-deazaguanine synthase, partial [Candidatus Diapherotrites archaeon]|nr:7-cyano-7-deazaguanine synthase [Candidatus Diapherotrites archaeon]
MDSGKFISEKTAEIKKTVGASKAVVALSGGVDSSVVAALAHKAIGRQLTCVFLDDGLMRENEGKSVKASFKKIGIEVQVRDVQHRFFDALSDQTDPEDKRKAFRDTFYKTL